MKKLKLILALAISILGIFQFSLVSQATSPTDDKPVSGSAISGVNLELANKGTTPSGTYGRSIRLRLWLKNVGDVGAELISIAPVVSASTASFPFEISKSSFSYSFDEDHGNSYLRAGDESDAISFNFQIRDDVTTGYYPVLFEVKYRDDGEDTVFKETLTYYVYLTGKDDGETDEKLDVRISLRNSSDTPIGTYGQVVKFDLMLTNYGKSNASSVTVSPKVTAESTTFPFKIEKISYEQQLASRLLGTSTQPNEGLRTQRVHYSYTVRDNVTTGYYPVVFQIKYLDSDGTEKTVDQTVFIYINGNPELDKKEETGEDANVSVPRIIITGYDTDVDSVKAGESFTLTLHMKNTSKITSVSNLKFTLSSTEDAFLPVSGSSTLFVDRIGSQGTVDLTIELSAKSDLPAKPHPITIDIEYEDAEVNPYTSKESISIPVTQELRISVGEVDVMPGGIEVGGQSNIMFAINNLGKSKVYNASVSFVGDTISGGESFKGNIDSGATSNVDVMVTGIAPTMDEGIVKAVITYENEKGEVFTEEKEFNLFVSEPYIPDPSEWDPSFNEDPDMIGENTGPNWWLIIGGIIVVVGGGVATPFIIKKYKKHKEGLDEDEIL